MLSRRAAAVVLGFAAFCLAVAMYSVGRMNGMEAVLQMQPPPAVAPDASKTLLSLLPGPESPSKELAMGDAQEVAKAMLLYAQNYDETFPPAGNPLTTKQRLAHYTSSDEAFSARGENIGPFYYTFDARSFATIAEPATVAIGYKDGPGGRAIILADGRTRWEPQLDTPPAMSPPTQ